MNLIRPDVLVTYGIGLMALNRMKDAEMQFRSALNLQPDHIAAHVELAKLCHLQGNDPEAIVQLDTALELDPMCADALFQYGKVMLWRSEDEKALTYFKAAAAIRPEKVGFLAAALEKLLLPERQKALNELRWVLYDHLNAQWKYEKPLWDGEPIGEKTLLVYTEGGFGDTIQLSRYLPLVKPRAQGRVVVECQKEMTTLLTCCPGVDEVVARDITVFRPSCPFDLQIGLMTLPLLFAAQGDQLPKQTPYLTADTAATEKWKTRFTCYPGLKVGLRWAGNPRYGSDATRSCHLANFAPLADVADVTFISLQKGAREEEAAKPPQGLSLVDLTSELGDFMETAAIISQLDLVISTDTNIPHLAGALGVPTFLVLDTLPNHRWERSGADCAWYPTMQIVRQLQKGDWNSALEAVAKELRHLVHISKGSNQLQVNRI